MANNTHDIHVEVKADASNVSKEMHKVVNAIKDVGAASQQSDKGLSDINKALQALVGYAQTSNNSLKNLSIQMRNLGTSAKATGKGLQEVGNGGESAQAVLGKVVAAAKGFVAVQAAMKMAEFGASCVEAGMQITKLKNSLEVLTGSAEKGRQTFKEFAQFAAETPFDTKEVIEYGKQMIAQGYAVNEVTKYLRVFGDTAAATGTDLGGVTLVMGQIRNSSKLMLQDVMQLQNRGVNVWQMLADASGKSMAEMKEAVHDGTVSGAQAFEMLAGQMEKTFGGMMDKQAQSLEGAINELGETVENIKAEFGEWLAEALKLKDAIKSLSNGIKDLVGATEENRKADTALNNVEAATRKALDDTKYILEELTDDYHSGRISLQEYTEKTEKIKEGCEIAQNGLNTVGIAVSDLQGLMNKGIITAGQYAKAIASISYNAAQLKIAQEGLTNAIKSGDTAAQQGYLNRIEAINAATATLASPTLNDDLQSGGKLQKEIPGASETTTKGGSKENAALKAAQEENKIKQERLKIENEYTRMKLQKEKALYDAQNAMIKQYGTEEQKLNVAMAEIEFNRKQAIAQEELAYKEQMLAVENAMKEAALKTNGQQEIDMLKEKLALLKETHKATIDNINAEAGNGVKNAETGYNNQTALGYATAAAGGTTSMLSYDAELEKAKQLAEIQSKTNLSLQEKEQRMQGVLEKYNQEKERIEAIGKIQSWSNGLAKQFAGAMTDWITGAKSFGEAMKSVLKQIIAQLIQAAIYAAIVTAATGGATKFGTAFAGGLATGGPVTGPGTSTSDSIPAMLSNGEYVLSAKATDALGVPFLNGLNTGKLTGFSTGGLVGVSGYQGERSSSMNSSTSSSLTLNISAVDANSFGDFLARGGLDSIKQALTDDDRMFGSAVGVW